MVSTGGLYAGIASLDRREQRPDLAVKVAATAQGFAIDGESFHDRGLAANHPLAGLPERLDRRIFLQQCHRLGWHQPMEMVSVPSHRVRARGSDYLWGR